MLLNALYLVAGLALLVLGGNWVTDGGAAIARRLRMSEMLVGLTIIAFGSATPDLVVGVISTLGGHSQLAVGDVLGANIFDFLLVIGILAVMRPLQPSAMTLRRDLPVAALVALVLFVMSDDGLIDGMPSNALDRSDGLVMLILLAVYLVYTVLGARTAQQSTPTSSAREMAWWLAALALCGGIGVLVLGGSLFVDGASAIALHLGWSEGLVGLTVVAIGGSLPDLATSVIAAAKGRPGIALGNIIGGGIFNVLLVLGVSATIAPLGTGTINLVDFLTFVGSAALVWGLAAFGRRHTIGRAGGVLLIALYVAYTAYLTLCKS